MEFLYGQLKKLEVISVTDGKNLGKICDMVIFLPEGKIKGFYVTGGKGFHFTKSDTFIPLGDVVKIGEDTILVKFGKEVKPPPKPNAPPNCQPVYPPPGKRTFDEGE